MNQTQPHSDAPLDPAAADLAVAAARAAAARKAEDVCVYDLHIVSSFCDAFIVCHGTNRRQVTAIAQGVMDDLRARGVRPIGVEGMDAGRWVLIDFGEIIVHVFDEPMRGFYDLDGLWGDAPRIPVDLGGVEPTAAHGAGGVPMTGAAGAAGAASRAR